MLIRHALPVRLEGGDGPADPELSTVGIDQARRLADYLVGEDLTALYTSPLRRALETAAPIAGRLGLTASVSDGLAEWDRHAAEYIPIEELKAANDPRWQALIDGHWEGDEDPAVFHDRVRRAVEAIIADHSGERVAVVCHGGVINSYVGQVLGLDLAGNGFFYPQYTSIHRIAASSTGVRSVVTLNETAHLPRPGRERA